METSNFNMLDDTLLDEHKDLKNLSDKDIFTKIWTQPRMVLEFIDKKEYDKWLFPILILLGINGSLENFINNDWGGIFTNVGVSILFGIIVGGLLGWISYYIFAAFLSFTGKWLGGEANTYDLFRMNTYAAIPSAFTILLFIPVYAIYALYGSDYLNEVSQNLLYYIAFIGFITFGIAVWSLVLTVVGISVTQKFSIGRSIGNIVLAFFMLLISAIPIGILVAGIIL
ncbi:Yip1 family protein [Marinigracilibium pacificum]|uniref:YIP1 family protein n=1 Tax=Marinigracilibium pacificum TaxID=2729599 RepID=A0A848IYY1_9BACT|nr:Yip1 family protein [Marinigracilibium pacificum]NMM47500.1 YIP1 family protein [Marinigracilibium pacificum]